jgi:hypothetical protein
MPRFNRLGHNADDQNLIRMVIYFFKKNEVF